VLSATVKIKRRKKNRPSESATDDVLAVNAAVDCMAAAPRWNQTAI